MPIYDERGVDFRVALAGAVALLVAACTGQPIPTSAQAGSTVVLPFASNQVASLGGPTELAFGGTDFPDPQRGSLVVQLDQQGGFELVTRLAFLAAAPVEAPVGPWGGGLGPVLLLMVDIPANAPVGTHSLELVRRRSEGGVPVDTPLGSSPASLSILPNQVVAGSETVTGAPNPSQFWASGSGFHDMIGDFNGDGTPDNLFTNVVPEPSFGVQVTTDDGALPPGAGSRFVALVNVDVSYPPGVIDVRRVVATEPTETLVWSSDDGNGNLSITALTKRRVMSTGVGPVRVVFALDDPDAALLDPAQVGVTLVSAQDELGDPSIVSDWGLTASTTGIR